MNKRSQKKRALVTGATGYVGWHLAERLLREDYTVHLLVRRGSDQQRLYKLPGRPLLDEYDGTTQSMFKALQRAEPDTVFHLAALTSAEHHPEDIEPMIRSNILLGTQLLEACAHHKTARFINTGTYWQHFQDRDYNPVCLYAATKQAFEDILRYYSETTPLRSLTLTLFDVYGPEDTRFKLIRQLQEAADAGAPLKMTPGKQLADFVHIDDVIEAYLQAERLLEEQPSEARGRSFAVRSGKPVSIREFVALYERLTQTNPPVEWGGRPYRPREVLSPWNGPTLPGWRARVGLEEGLLRVLHPSTETAPSAKTSHFLEKAPPSTRLKASHG